MRSLIRNCAALIDVGRVGGEREIKLLVRGEPPECEDGEIGRVQRQHQHAEHVFPEEGRREQVAAEDLLFPDAAGDHDRVEAQRLDHDGDGRGREAFAGRQIAQHQREADQEDRELDRGEHTLDEGPARLVAA